MTTDQSRRGISCFAGIPRVPFGFTLIEMMVVLAILGILAAIAGPTLKGMTSGPKVRTAAYDLYAALMFARSEAVKRNQDVSIAPVTAGHWEAGWNVTAADGTSLRKDAARSDLVISGGTGGFTYRNDGRLTGTPVTVSIDTSSGGYLRCVQVTPTGIPKIIRPSGGSC